MFASDNGGARAGVVLLIATGDQQGASDRIARGLFDALTRRGEVVDRVAVEGSVEVREAIEGAAARGTLAAAVICADDATSAATLIWELVGREGSARFGDRVLVVLGDDARLDSLPGRLLEALEFVSVADAGIAGVVRRVETIVAQDLNHQRPVDLLASVYRSAISKRSPEPLLVLGDALEGAVELELVELPTIARIGDGGRRPNPLWARWAGFERELRIREAAPGSRHLPPTKRSLKKRKKT